MPQDNGREIQPADGRLGVLLVGLGAVSTTTIAGVESIRRGLSKPIGSLTQMNTIRLGKRTEGRTPLIKEFVPLVELDAVALAVVEADGLDMAVSVERPGEAGGAVLAAREQDQRGLHQPSRFGNIRPSFSPPTTCRW